ncbi:hypothetical protein Pfo_007376 [Paulownia fortunei]|nr:hypothetical protein Pfo_007376 [Paulownia fortunei]
MQHYYNIKAMEPSTTNIITISHENQHKNHTSSNDQLPSDHQPLIISCKDTPHQEKNPSSNPSTCVVISEALSMENAGDEQEKGLGNEKMKRHWKEVSVGGRIVIPEAWGQEDLLKDWIDYSTFDALLAPKEVGLAREALVAEARRGRGMSKLRV